MRSKRRLKDRLWCAWCTVFIYKPITTSYYQLKRLKTPYATPETSMVPTWSPVYTYHLCSKCLLVTNCLWNLSNFNQKMWFFVFHEGCHALAGGLRKWWKSLVCFNCTEVGVGSGHLRSLLAKRWREEASAGLSAATHGRFCLNWNLMVRDDAILVNSSLGFVLSLIYWERQDGFLTCQ